MKRSIAAWLDRRRVTGAPPPASDPRDSELCVLPEALPWPPAGRVLVFAPHPDDEAIGCGGLIVRLVEAGVAVRVVLVTDGSGAGDLPRGAAQVRQREFLASLAQLGVSDHVMLGFADGELVAAAPLFEAVDAQVRDFAPQWLVGPSAADAHRDHRCTAHAVRHAALAHPCVQLSLEYETWGALPATHVLDITDQLATKLAALAEHATALAQMDYARAADGLARYRGLLLRDKREQAAGEAFVCTNRASGFAWPTGWGRPRS
jgi:LmbE family N-acetylglucosaminyl deacetylase